MSEVETTTPEETQSPEASAAPAAPTRRKGKRQVVDGLAHIHASFNNTIIMITDRQGGLFHGQLLVGQDSVALERARHSQRR